MASTARVASTATSGFPWGCCCVCPKRARPTPSSTVTSLPNAYVCIGPTARRYLRNVIQYSLLMFVLMILVLWIGMEVQEYHVIRTSDTLHLYAGNQVCGLSYPEGAFFRPTPISQVNKTIAMTKSSSSSSTSSSSLVWTLASPNANATLEIQTYNSAENATFHDNNTLVAHCGDCGQCSNPQDVAIYDSTKNSLLETTIHCAKRALLWGRKTTSKCMQELVNLTPGCNECWVENIMCDLRYCVFICFWHAIFSQLVSEDDEIQTLNRCTLCDEKRCGPEFLQCAGVNRRRSGILSDIERDADQEVCRKVEPAWWKSKTLQQIWQVQTQQTQHQQQQQQAADADSSSGNNDDDDGRRGLRRLLRR